MTEPTPDHLATVSTFALRIVLCCLSGDGDGTLLAATLAELDRDNLELLVRLLGGLAAGIWRSTKGHDEAIAEITCAIAELLDAADHHREDHP